MGVFLTVAYLPHPAFVNTVISRESSRRPPMIFKPTRCALQHLFQTTRRLPCRRLLATMPKNVDLTERRDARSAKTKKLKSYGPPGQVKLHVLGSGAEGAPRALYVFTTSAR